MPTSSLTASAVGEAGAPVQLGAGQSWSDSLLTALAPMIWGSTYLVTTNWLPPDRPVTVACLRILPAGLALILMQRRKIPARLWRRLLLLAVLNIGLFQVLLFAAAYRLPGGIAATLGALMPLVVLGLAWIVDQSRPSLPAIGAGALAVLGMVLIFGGPPMGLDPVGLLAAAGGTLSLALGTYLTARKPLPLPLLESTGWQLTLAGLVLAPVAFLLEPGWPRLELSHFASLTYLAIPGALVGYTLWFRGLRRLSAPAVSALGLLSPLTALLLGWWFRDERFSPLQLTGMALVLIAVLLLQRTPARR